MVPIRMYSALVAQAKSTHIRETEFEDFTSNSNNPVYINSSFLIVIEV